MDSVTGRTSWSWLRISIVAWIISSYFHPSYGTINGAPNNHDETCTNLVARHYSKGSSGKFVEPKNPKDYGFTIQVNATKVQAGQTVKITIKRLPSRPGNTFQGYLLAHERVGQQSEYPTQAPRFLPPKSNLPSDQRYKYTNCTKFGRDVASMVTSVNNNTKRSVDILWMASYPGGETYRFKVAFVINCMTVTYAIESDDVKVVLPDNFVHPSDPDTACLQRPPAAWIILLYTMSLYSVYLLNNCYTI